MYYEYILNSGARAMALYTFIQDAGEELFQGGPAVPAAGAEQALLAYIAAQALSMDGVTLVFEPATATVTLSGKALDQTTREKIILCCGNAEGVAHVDDQLAFAEGEVVHTEWYSTQHGDNLPNISQRFYGDANKYMDIFEANTPMLPHPDKIYLGQMLRIPRGSRKCFEPTILWRKNRHAAVQAQTPE